MNRVKIELWFWLGKELGRDFHSPSQMCCSKEEFVEEGTAVWQLLEDLAKRYPAIAERIYDSGTKRVYPNVVVNYNDRVISPHTVHEQVLKDGDKITLMPLYAGG